MTVNSITRSNYYICLCLLLCLLLSACDLNSAPHASLSSPTPFHTISITPATQQNVPGTSVSFSLGQGISVESASGLVCHFNKQGSGSPTPGTLVLAKREPTYSEGTVQSLQNYLDTVGAGFIGGQPDTVAYPPFSVDTTAFQLVAVNTAQLGCSETFQFMNNGNASVYISQVSLQLLQDTQVNTQHYQLIDACSLSLTFLAQGCPPTLGALEPGYVALFNLHAGKAQQKQAATCWGYDDASGCLPQQLELKTGAFAKITLTYFSTTQNALSLSLQPLFTLHQQGKLTMSYSAPQLRVTFAFAALDQFSCYAFHNQQFLVVPLDNTHWCI